MTDLNRGVSRFFPYENVRPFQDEFMETIFNSVKEGKSAVIEGTNGLGKTMAVLCACLPTALEDNLKILYVARTHRQHERVIEELRSISKKRSVSGVSIRGRREMCLNHFAKKNAKDARAFMDICELLKSRNRCPYYSNIDDKERQYFEIRTHFTLKPYTASEIREVCRQKRLLPI